MAFPAILFNNASGSDTAASGAGPGTALTGTGASLNASTTIDLSADAPDLTNVATDGSHCLWVKTSSGRQFFKIVGKDNTAKTITTETAAGVTESSRTWAIGGKRKTLDDADSRLLFSADAKAGWVAELEDAQSLTSTLTVNIAGNVTDGYFVIRGSGGSLKTITQTANAAVITTSSSIDFFKTQYLKLQNTNGTKTNADGIRHVTTSRLLLVEFCEIGDATNQLQIGVNRDVAGAPNMTIRGSYIHHCLGSGASNQGGSSSNISVYSSIIADNGGAGITCVGTGGGGPSDLFDSVFARNVSGGARVELGICRNCVFDDNGAYGLTVTAAAPFASMIANNIFSNNDTFGLIGYSGIDFISLMDFNNFYNNTSGARSAASAGANDLTVDPQYVNAAGNDWSIGTNLTAKGFPGAGAMALGVGLNTMTSYVDIGAAQRQEAGGGGLMGNPFANAVFGGKT